MEQARKRTRDGESGNVLFLILIAVALFAALSYAVTQSTRSGAGDTASETNLISSASLTQYPAGVRTSVVRMIIGGIAVDELEFNSPSDFGNLSAQGRGVFHPNGGNATYQMAPPDVMANASQGTWYFNGNFEIDNIGQDDPSGFNGNDIIAFLPGLKQGICERINNQLGLGSSVPDSGADWSGSYTVIMDDGYSPGTEDFIIGTGPTVAFVGQPFGCFRNNGGDFVYFHVLVER